MDQRQIELLDENYKIKLDDDPEIIFAVEEILKQGAEECPDLLFKGLSVMNVTVKVNFYKKIKYHTIVAEDGYYYYRGHANNCTGTLETDWETYVRMLNDDINAAQAFKLAEKGKIKISGNFKIVEKEEKYVKQLFERLREKYYPQGDGAKGDICPNCGSKSSGGDFCTYCGHRLKSRRKIPKHVKREVWRRDQGRCVECGSKIRLEFDHIIPFSKGGSNTARNIQLLCEECNRKKSDKI